MTLRSINLCSAVLFVLILGVGSSCSAQEEVSAFAFDLTDNRVLLNRSGDRALKPASTLKIVTSGAALRLLGTEYRFQTEFLTDSINKGAARTLYVRGAGDPSITSERMWMIVRQLYALGVRSVDSVILDESLFGEEIEREGQRAYQSRPAPLSFNHNSIAVQICPTSLGQPAITSIEPEESDIRLIGGVTTSRATRALEVEERGLDKSTGLPFYRVSGAIKVGAGCQTLYRSVSDPGRYFAHSLIGLMRSNGIRVSANLRFAPVPNSAERLFTCQSPELHEIVAGLNHFSTNVTAELLAFALGSRARPVGIVRDDGLAQIRSFLNSLGIPEDQSSLVDGSGLNHQNRLSARALVTVLSALYRDPNLQPEFVASLPIAGLSGTLKDRPSLSRGYVVRAKTGTLDGVSALAGYVMTKQQRVIAFAILQNGVTSKDSAVETEERIVERFMRERQ